MDMLEILKSLEGTALATTIRDSLFLFPMLEAVHVIGLALVFGTITVIDLRLLGVASVERPFKLMASEILKWTWAAFVLTAVTGALMFTTNAQVYYDNFYFRTKLVLLLFAGVNMAAFELTARRSVAAWDRDAAAPPAGRRVAVLSLAIWVVVIFLGRWVGFTLSTTAAPASEELNLEELENLIPK